MNEWMNEIEKAKQWRKIKDCVSKRTREEIFDKEWQEEWKGKKNEK